MPSWFIFSIVGEKIHYEFIYFRQGHLFVGGAVDGHRDHGYVADHEKYHQWLCLVSSYTPLNVMAKHIEVDTSIQPVQKIWQDDTIKIAI